MWLIIQEKAKETHTMSDAPKCETTDQNDRVAETTKPPQLPSYDPIFGYQPTVAPKTSDIKRYNPNDQHDFD